MPVLFAPVLSGCELTGDTRTVRFSNGRVVHERVRDVDDSRMRMAYAALDVPGMTYHHASMEMVGVGPRRCRFVWTTDFLPAEMRAPLAPLIEAGSNALKSNLDRSLGSS